MSKQDTGLRRWLGGVLLLIVLLVLLGLLIVSYQAALALVAGIVVAILLLIVGRWLIHQVRKSQRRGLWIAAGLATLVCLGAVVVLALIGPVIGGTFPIEEEASEEPVEAQSEVPPRVVIETYTVEASPLEKLVAGVWVQERLIYDVVAGDDLLADDEDMILPERRVLSRRKGFLLREVTVEPLGEGPYATVSVPWADGSTLDARLCGATCPVTTIRVEDLPKGAFYAARGTETVNVTEYINTEIITWTTSDLSDGIVFAYITPPFQVLRPVLAPLIGASNANEWAIGVFGMLTSVIGAPLIKPVAENLVQDAVLDWGKEKIAQRRGRKARQSRK